MSGFRVAFETLGCKLNQYETDAIAAEFQRLGWTIVAPPESADAYILNTCTVTDKADRKSRYLLRHVERCHLSPIIVVTGCFAESSRTELEAQDGVTFVVPNAQKNQIPTLVDAYAKGEITAPALPPPDPFDFAVHGRVFHTRASLKIQDGCDNFCTFCIIPSVRGRALSRPRKEVLTAAQQMIREGRRELVLTGVNMGRWSEGGHDFTALVEDLLALEGDFRLRITSLEPEGLGPRFVKLLSHPKMAPHLHLCLQSGSPRMLLAMRREYSVDQYVHLVGQLRYQRPDLNVTTDVIVGFPGETEEEFSQTVELVKAMAMGHVHVFPYSRRQGTRADRMEQQLPEAVKVQRSRFLQKEAGLLRREVMAKGLERPRRVLVETLDQNRSDGWLKGLTEDYFPIRFQGQTPWNEFVVVTPKRILREREEWFYEGEA